MKKLFLFSLLTVLFISCFSFDLDAQSRRKKKKKKKKKPQDEYFDESAGFVHKLWYGGSGTLGFNGFNGGSAFNIGVSPMVAYKFNDNFSAGLRTEIDFYYEKIITGGENYKYQSLAYGAGPFARARVWRVFAHSEYMFRSLATPLDENGVGPYIDPDDSTKIQSFRYPQEKFNIGLGYNSGDIFAYEIYALYNVLEDLQTNDSPFELRIGFTYKF